MKKSSKYICEECGMALRNDEGVMVYRGKLFHTHRDCLSVYLEKHPESPRKKNT